MAIDDIALTLVRDWESRGSFTCWRFSVRRRRSSPHRPMNWPDGRSCVPTSRAASQPVKSHPEAERELRHCRRHGITPLASTDDAYPALLREIPDYPHVLYIKGNAEVLSQRCLSMVGTRRISTYGQRLCDELVRG